MGQNLTIKSGIYKNSELLKILGNPATIKKFLNIGAVEKISRGFYATPDIPTNKTFFLIIQKFYKKSVISKRTLLHHYGLTTAQPELIDLDVSQNSQLRLSTDLVKIHRTNKIFEIEMILFNGVLLRTYSVERSLFEVLYFEKTAGSLTSEVIRNYLARYEYKPAVIFNISKKFGKNGAQLANLIHVVAGDK